MFGLTLLWIAGYFIFQCIVTGDFMGERGPACLSFLYLALIRGSLRPPQSLHTHHVPNCNTLSPPCLFSYFSILSKFDFKFASCQRPSHISPPTPTCWFTTLYLLPHSSVSFCTTVYSYIYIVSITRVLVVPSRPSKPQAI